MSRYAALGASNRHASKGQSLVELALILPVLLLLLVVAIDFGRLFSSWVTLNNAARVAANYAGANPTQVFTSPSEYATLVNGEGYGSLGSTCATSGVPAPDFNDSSTDTNTTEKDLGDSATVSLTCTFKVLTPGISAILGSTFPVSASSTFSIRTGVYLP